MRNKILVIEDNPDLASILPMHLADAGADVEVAIEGRSGLERATKGVFDLIILDLILPELGGLEICKRLRATQVFTPILMLTSRSAELDRVKGFAHGADDYLTKPFSIAELQARVKAIFRRRDRYSVAKGLANEKLTFGTLGIDPASREVVLAGQIITLTAREFDLLLHFMRAPGRVFTRAELLDDVWGQSHDALEHTVNSHINRLRAKIEPDVNNPSYILTVWGVGYKFGLDSGTEGR